VNKFWSLPALELFRVSKIGGGVVHSGIGLPLKIPNGLSVGMPKHFDRPRYRISVVVGGLKGLTGHGGFLSFVKLFG
jgi:hypothetical protein